MLDAARRLVKVIPFTTVVVTLILVLGVAKARLFGLTPSQYVAITIVFAVLVGWCEWRLGTRAPGAATGHAVGRHGRAATEHRGVRRSRAVLFEVRGPVDRVVTHQLVATLLFGAPTASGSGPRPHSRR